MCGKDLRMHQVSTIILGNPRFISPETVDLDLIITFEEPVANADILLDLNGTGHQAIQSRAVDAWDEREDQPDSEKARHHLFYIQNLTCGEEYSYQVQSLTQDIVVLPAIGEKEGRPLAAQQFIAPPAPGQSTKIKLITSADQEGIDAMHCTSIDNLVAKLLNLNLDQRELTTEIYKEIALRHPHMFFQMGDLFHGENLLPERQVSALADFRHHIDLDFNQTVRDRLAGTISFRTLDDHDLGRNAVDAAEFAKKPWPFKNAIRAFNEFFPVPKVPTDQERGLFYHVTYGDLDVWFLHNRLYKQEGTLLGAEQKQWLKDTLTASTAKAKVIVTPLPFVMGKDPEEDYRVNPEEFDELMRLFAENDVTAIFSADSHNYSRTDLHIHLDEEVIIPHFVVGILGGKPQALSKAERDSLPDPYLPEGIKEKYSDSHVEFYYTPANRPSTNLLGLIGNKKHRSFQQDHWVGKEVAKHQYGFLEVEFDFAAQTMMTHLHTQRKKESKKGLVDDDASYSLKPKHI